MPARASALLVGVTFVLIGVLRLVPAVAVNLAIGVIGVALARTDRTARIYLFAGGAVSLALWVVGVAGIGGFLPVSPADNWLHLVLGAGMVVLGSSAP